jgi:predicted permease
MNRPPFLARLLLSWLLPARDREFIVGDLDEEFLRVRRARDGWWRARWWYWRQAFASLFSEVRYELGEMPVPPPGAPRRASRFDALRQDIRYALRSLNRRPIFTTVAVLTLALGIGANSAIFSIANWLLLRPVSGVVRPHEVVVIEFARQRGNSLGISWLNLQDMRRSLTSFSALAGEVSSARLQVLVENAAPMDIDASAVAGDYFGLLGARVQRGRPILEAETAPGQAGTVAVISDGLWSRLFQRDPAVIGKTLRANKLALTIVGVAAPGFQGAERFAATDVWVPYAVYGRLRHMDEKYYYERGTGIRVRELYGRLAPGVTPEAARADLQRALDLQIQQYPADNEIYTEYPASVHPGLGLRVLIREHVETLVKLMLLMVGLLLVISSANVANMLLVRGVQKRPEQTIRLALGASRRRLLVQNLVESMVLALLGGVAGLLVLRVVLFMAAGGTLLRLPPIQDVPIDIRVLAFVLGISVLTGLIFGLAPYGLARGTDLLSVMHAGSARHTPRASLVRKGIVVLQVCLSMILLVGALLVGKTMRALLDVQTGFDHERVAGISISAEPQGYSGPEAIALGQRVLQQLRQQTGVERAALAYTIPFGRVRSLFSVRDPDDAMGEAISLQMLHVSDGYFETLGIPLVRGRSLQERDWVGADTMHFNVVLSETAARRLFGQRDAIGRTLVSRRGEWTMQVVGVARAARLDDVRSELPDLVYLPMHTFGTFGQSWFSVVMRTNSSPAALEPVARSALRAADAGIPLNFQLVTTNLGNWVAEERLLARLLFLFSTLAVLLAAIGLYGVLASIVGERRREFGIHMALGARPVRILALVARQSAVLVVSGIMLGLLGAGWLSRLIEGALFGVDRLDISSYASASLLFLASAAAATTVPTRAAITVPPTEALRQD